MKPWQSLAQFQPEAALVKVPPLLLELDTDDSPDPARYLLNLLGWSAGERTWLDAAKDYLTRGDFVRSARCLREAPQKQREAGLPDLAATWTQFVKQQSGAHESLQSRALALHRANVEWESSQDLKESLERATIALGQCESISGNLVERIAQIDTTLIRDLQDNLDFVGLACDDGDVALARRRDEAIAILKATKREADAVLDDLLLQSDPIVAERAKTIHQRLLSRFQGRDGEQAAKLLEDLRCLQRGEYMPDFAPVAGSAPLSAQETSKAPEKPRAVRELTREMLSQVARVSLGDWTAVQSKAAVKIPPQGSSSAFNPWEWREAVLRERALATAMLARNGDDGLGEYLMAEAKLRLLRDETSSAILLFVDAFRWASSSPGNDVVEHRGAAAAGVLLASSLAYLAPRDRRPYLDPKRLSELVQKRLDTVLLPAIERRALMGAQAGIATRMGPHAGPEYLRGSLLPYLEHRPRAAQAFVLGLIAELTDAPTYPGKVATALRLLGNALGVLVPGFRGAGAGWDWAAAGRGVGDEARRDALRLTLQQLRGVALQLAGDSDLAAFVQESLEPAIEELEVAPVTQESSPYVQLLTPHVILGEGARLIVEISLPKRSSSLRDLRPEVDLFDGEGRAQKGALASPAVIARLSPGERQEVLVPFENLALPFHARLRVRTFQVGLDGVTRLVPVRNEQFNVLLEAPQLIDQLPANPYVVGPPVQTRKRIYGRDKEVGDVWQALTGTQQDNVVLVLGERRIGKSTLLNAIEETPFFRERYVIVKEDLQGLRYDTSAESLFGTRLMNHVRTGLRDAGIEPPLLQDFDFAKDTADAFQRYMNGVDTALNAVDRRLLLILDELDQLLEHPTFGKMGIAVLRAVIQSARRVSFILCGATEVVNRHTATREDRLFKLAREVKVLPLAERDARRLVQEPVEAYYQFTETAVDLVLGESNRQPYLIQYVCSLLFTRMMQRGVRVVTATEVEETLEDEVITKSEVFYDFTVALAPDELALVKAMAMLQVGHRYVSLADLQRELRHIGQDVSAVDLSERLRRLIEKAPLVVEEKEKLTTRFYRLRVGLFARHLRMVQGG